MRMMAPMKALADHNIAGPLNVLLKPVQEGDTVSAWGSRNVILSTHRNYLEGFQLNKKTLFDFVIRSPLECTISRSAYTAEVMVPALIPNVNFLLPRGQVLYSLVVVLGIIPDLTNQRGKYEPVKTGYETLTYATAETEWNPVAEKSEVHHLSVTLPKPPDDSFTLMVTVGIRYGVMLSSIVINQVKYAGSAKILKTG